jgi:hypothetical protein
MTEIVFFLEERSAEEMLYGLMPKLLPEGDSFRCIVFEGKADLEKKLEKKMRHYLKPGAKFIVLRDQDSGDCMAIKRRFLEICNASGRLDYLVRIACHELESWYLGDLEAVEAGLGIPNLSALQNKASYRDPDRLNNAKQELQRLTKNVYVTVSGSRDISPHLNPDRNKSQSFMCFVAGIKRLLEASDRTTPASA